MPKNDTNSKRVALVITRLDRGGSAELTMQLAAGLRQNGYKVLLISGKTLEPVWNPVQYAQDNRFLLQYVNSLIRSLHPIWDVVALFRLITILRKFRPDILHTNSSKAGILGRLAGHICGIQKIYHSPHGHIFYGYYNPLVSKLFI
ncbi:MAG: glycosyltransferase, partial [Candidatus Marinimicrobia bacterium]|nr:glycosyltransferase [Candidatus Neomarinimicrobiota bacterium]